MASNYDNSAWFYDRLSRLIYGRAIINAQVYLLDQIQSGSNILIVGGGTGWILEEISKRYPAGLNITYVEISAKMTTLSRNRNTGSNHVIYVNDAIENLSDPREFDVVITAFLFDNYADENLQSAFAHIHTFLKPGGVWLNVDFRLTGKWWQKVLLKAMLLFFRIICRIESTRLPNTEKCFEQYAYRIIKEQSFFGEFIHSTASKSLEKRRSYPSYENL